MKSIRSSQSGNVILYVVIILGFTALTAFAISTKASLDSFTGSAEQIDSSIARDMVFSCLDEILLQLLTDDEYSPTTLSISGESCSVTISSVGDARTVEISSTRQRITRELHVELTVDPVSVTSMVESIN